MGRILKSIVSLAFLLALSDTAGLALQTKFPSRQARPDTALAAPKTWPYDVFGSPGQVIERHDIAGLGATALRFANGVRLIVRPSDLQKDEILISVRFGSGLMEMRPDEPTLGWILSGRPGIGGLGFTGGGLGKLSLAEMQAVLAGSRWSAGSQIDESAFSLLGQTGRQDFARQMQILAAYVKDPGWRPTVWDSQRGVVSVMRLRLAATLPAVVQIDVDNLLHSRDRRWGWPSPDEIASSSIADARRLLEPGLTTGRLDIIITGDIALEEAIRQTATTFGSLQPRAPRSITAYPVKFPAPGSDQLVHNGRVDQGLALIAWPTTDTYSDPRGSRVLQLLCELLRLRLIDQIRAKHGGVYPSQALTNSSRTFDNYGYLAAFVEVPPNKLDTLFADIRQITADFQERPVSAYELQKAREPYVEQLKRNRTLNMFWLDNLGGVQERPERAHYIRTGIDTIMSITPEELQRAARQYLVDGKAWRLTISPEFKSPQQP